MVLCWPGIVIPRTVPGSGSLCCGPGPGPWCCRGCSPVVRWGPRPTSRRASRHDDDQVVPDLEHGGAVGVVGDGRDKQTFQQTRARTWTYLGLPHWALLGVHDLKLHTPLHLYASTFYMLQLKASGITFLASNWRLDRLLFYRFWQVLLLICSDCNSLESFQRKICWKSLNAWNLPNIWKLVSLGIWLIWLYPS